MNETNLTLGLLLLGVAGLAGFLAFRPWPVDPATSTGPLSPGVYVVELLEGNPPAASNPPDHQGNIATIEGGLAALLGVWIFSKLASGASKSLPSGGGAAASSEEESAGSTIEKDATDLEEAA